MSQIINIFRKDVRHHWIEIVVCQVALIGYFWRGMHDWYVPAHHSRGLDIPLILIDVSLPLAWWILIVRVIQGESLVGDRQFWTTRPYEWKKLLCAKALFVIAFLSAPLFCAQIFHLMKAGFSPWPNLYGLMWMQLLLICFPILPIMALAAVTKNFVQAALALLMIALTIVGVAALTDLLPHSSMSSLDASDSMQAAAAVLASLMAIWLQYKKRNAFRARMFLCAGAVAISLIIIGEPFLVHRERAYLPSAAGSYPMFQVATYDDKPSPASDGVAKAVPAKRAPENDNPTKDEPVEIEIPVETSGLVNGTFGQVRGLLLSLESPDGSQWSSNWESSYRFLLPGKNRTVETFKMDYKTYERLKSIPLKARISVAVDIYRDQDARTVTSTNRHFAVQGVGWCWIDPKDESDILCHTPLVKPHQILVRLEPSDSTCIVDDNTDDDSGEGPETPVFAWESNGDSDPAEYGFSPVESMDLSFSNHYGTGWRNPRICPGTPLSFSFPKLGQRTRAQFEIAGFKPSDYRKPPLRFTNRIYVVPKSKAQ